MNADTRTDDINRFPVRSPTVWNCIMWLTQPSNDITLAAASKDSYADLPFPPPSLSLCLLYLLPIPSSSPPTSVSLLLCDENSRMKTAADLCSSLYTSPLPTPSWATALTLFLTFSLSLSQCGTRTVICFSSLMCAGDSAGVSVIFALST